MTTVNQHYHSFFNFNIRNHTMNKTIMPPIPPWKIHAIIAYLKLIEITTGHRPGPRI